GIWESSGNGFLILRGIHVPFKDRHVMPYTQNFRYPPSFRQDRLFPPWGKHGLLLLETRKRIFVLENKPYID
ncbi:MAG: hypothetical protein ACYC43_02300, partial [Burkholderiales bacterium]